MAGRNRYSDKAIEAALMKTRGMAYVAAKLLGCKGQTIAERIARSPRLQAVVKAESETVDDEAEMRLMQAITNGEPWAIRFRLTRKASTRGYNDSDAARGLSEAESGIMARIDEYERQFRAQLGGAGHSASLGGAESDGLGKSLDHALGLPDPATGRVLGE